MDKDRFAKKTSKTVSSRNINVTWEFLSKDYRAPTVAAEATPSATGHLELLRIEPKRTRMDMPTFSVRWDHKDDSVDVDLLWNSDEESHRFKVRELGYRGHHTHKLDQPLRTHAIDIATPATGSVFKGTITLNVDLAESLEFEASPRIECNAEVIRGGKTVDEGS
jgi:hypothetical protein